jgi:hypothetical protein
VVAWRLRRLFSGAGPEQAPALERGVVELLREKLGLGRARRGRSFPADALERLAARRQGATRRHGHARRLGVGSLLLIVLGAAGFMSTARSAT